MHIDFRCLKTLPRLAWLAAVDLRQSVATVLHGHCVETGSQWFAEGIWNGDFRAGDLANSDCVFGSGGNLSDQGMVFISSTATTDYLYYKTLFSSVIVSNSLPMLLAHLHDRLDESFLNYAQINNSIVDGIDAYTATIPTRGGDVKRLIYRNLLITKDSVTEIDKPQTALFATYAEYLSCLRQNTGLLVSNARDSHRTSPMKIFSTQSRGYDTTAVNSIMGPLGIDRTFTCNRSKEQGTFFFRNQGETKNDDGTEICERLGLESTRIDRLSIFRKFDDECLYYAALHKNTDMNLREIHDHIDGVTVLLTGTLGEMWSTRDSAGPGQLHAIDNTLKRMYLPGNGLSEVRLHEGLIHLAVPFIGARQRVAIDRITESDEMSPWRLNNDYDRPIPRRIAEESGIPRHMFGQEKMATIVDFPIPSVPFDKKLRYEYFDFLRNNDLLSRVSAWFFPLIHRINNYICWKQPQRYLEDHRRHRWTYYLGQAVYKATGRRLRIRRLWSHLDGSLYCFCVNKVADGYAEKISSIDDKSGLVKRE